MSDEHRINEALAGSSDAAYRSNREVEELAEKLFIAILQADHGSRPADAFLCAEDFLAERDRRREVKR